MIFRGWSVVVGAFLVLFIAYGAQYSFGLFFTALLDEFHWSRASLSGVFSLYAFAYSGFGFAAGRLTDLWGPRSVIAAGGIFLGVALMGMALVSQLWQPYVLYGLVAAVGMSTAYVPCSATIVRWFHRRRGLAVGCAAAGQSLGTFLLPPVGYVLISRAGWRWAYVTFGAAVCLVLVAVSRIMYRDPESLGLAPYGADPPETAAGTPAASAPVVGWPLRDAMRTRAFKTLVVLFGATWIPVFVPLVHLVAHLRDLGHSTAVGAWVTGLIGMGAIGGRILMGAFSDRFGRVLTLAIGLALEAAAFLGLALAQHLVPVAMAAGLFGFAYATISVIYPALIADYFGRAHAGAIVGALFAIAGCPSGLGPIAAGALYDATGTYRMAFAASAALNAGALLLTAFCTNPGPPPEVSTSAARVRGYRGLDGSPDP